MRSYLWVIVGVAVFSLAPAASAEPALPPIVPGPQVQQFPHDLVCTPTLPIVQASLIEDFCPL